MILFNYISFFVFFVSLPTVWTVRVLVIIPIHSINHQETCPKSLVFFMSSLNPKEV